ncbi:MAG: TetR/AcrR family transcriptional regulator [Nitrososphaerales archaeon]
MVVGEERRVQERSLATRGALLDAALECLVERGYAATTTLEIARRAGVSRGAQLHHFPTKAELLAAAVEHLFERRLSEFRAAFAGMDPGANRLDEAIDLLWSMFQGPTFVAWVEVWVAARTDPELRIKVTEVDRRFAEQSQAIFAELFPVSSGVDPGFQEVGRSFAYAFMDGLALQCMVPRDLGDVPAHMIEALKGIARLVIDSTG